jgi:hypothetical protein
MHPLKTAMAGLLMATAPFLTHADDMSYRYFQVGYMQIDVDLDADFENDGFIADDESGDGFATRGSFGFADNFFVFTEYSKQSFDFDAEDTVFGDVPVNIDVDQITIGLGGHYPLSDNLDLVGRAGWSGIKVDVEFDDFDEEADDTGYLVGGGLRGRLGENFELEGGVVYQDFGGGADDTGGEILARWHFNKTWALAAEYQDIGEISSFIIGVRASF